MHSKAFIKSAKTLGKKEPSRTIIKKRVQSENNLKNQS